MTKNKSNDYIGIFISSICIGYLAVTFGVQIYNIYDFDFIGKIIILLLFSFAIITNFMSVELSLENIDGDETNVDAS